jgi:hypothetical protein
MSYLVPGSERVDTGRAHEPPNQEQSKNVNQIHSNQFFLNT